MIKQRSSEFKSELNLTDAGRLFANCKTVVITTHLMPDGDGLGAEIALYHYLKLAGKKVEIINPDALPERYKFIDPTNIIQTVDYNKKWGGMEDFDLAIIMDTSDPRRINGLWEIFSEKAGDILILDHHPNLAPHLNVSHKAKLHSVVDERSSSIGELLYRLFHHAHDLISDKESAFFHYTPEIALGLYVSIITDTNSFRYSRTTALSHRIAADLIDFGLQPEEVYQNVYSTKAADHLRLIGEVLSGVQETKDGKIVWAKIPKKLRDRHGATTDDTLSIINFLMLHKKAEVLIMLREEDDGKTRVSLKSKGRQPVNTIADQFGGGGHEFAAGFAHSSSMDVILKELLEKLGQ